jgi:hypothetical protein
MITMRHLQFGTGYDDERKGTEVAALFGLRTRGKSFLSASIGAAKARASQCPGPCSVATGSGQAYELGATAALPWVSLGLMYTETRAGRSTSWHGVVLNAGVGKFR